MDHFLHACRKDTNDGEREGKRRLQIDIEVIEYATRTSTTLSLRSEGLRDSDSRREYLGHEGLGCFLDGRYARTTLMPGCSATFRRARRRTTSQTCLILFGGTRVSLESLKTASGRNMVFEGAPDLCLVAPTDWRITWHSDLSHVSKFPVTQCRREPADLAPPTPRSSVIRGRFPPALHPLPTRSEISRHDRSREARSPPCARRTQRGRPGDSPRATDGEPLLSGARPVAERRSGTWRTPNSWKRRSPPGDRVGGRLQGTSSQGT